jgi:hypothetical protein
VISQLIDTVVILSLAFSGKMPTAKLVELMITSYSVKLTVAILITPLLYAGHAAVERGLGLQPVPVDSAPR